MRHPLQGEDLCLMIGPMGGTIPGSDWELRPSFHITAASSWMGEQWGRPVGMTARGNQLSLSHSFSDLFVVVCTATANIKVVWIWFMDIKLFFFFLVR